MEEKPPKPPKVKRNYIPPLNDKRGISANSEWKGDAKRPNPFHMSINELIEMKTNGRMALPLIINDEIVYKLGSFGVSIENICGLMDISKQGFYANPHLVEAHARGRAEIGIRNRARLVQHSEEGNVPAAIHLDKIFGGDFKEADVNINFINTEMKSIPTEDLLEIIYKETNKDDSQDA